MPLQSCGPSHGTKPRLEGDLCDPNCDKQDPAQRFSKFCILFGGERGGTQVSIGAPLASVVARKLLDTPSFILSVAKFFKHESRRFFSIRPR